MLRSRRSLLVLVVFASACAGSGLDVGQTEPSAPSAPEPSAPEPSGPEPISVGPPPPCVPVGDARVVADVRNLEATAFAPYGDTLWFGGENVAQAAREIYRVPIAGGAPERVVDRNYVGGLDLLDGRLAYVAGQVAHQLGAGVPDNVVLRDLGTGVVQKLDNPRTTTSVVRFSVEPTGLYWETRESDIKAPFSVSRWDPATGKPRELITLAYGTGGWAVDGRELFYLRSADAVSARLEAVPIRGGAPRLIATNPSVASSFWHVVGVDDTTVYVTKSDINGLGGLGIGDLVAMNKDGTGERTLVARHPFGDSVAMDAQYFYFGINDGDTSIPESRIVYRAPRTGGTPEPFGQGAVVVQEIRTDACNVYWRGYAGPTKIYARSR